MSTAPAELTQERIDAMISRVAEACMEGIEEARGHMTAAEDAEAFERATRSFNGVCRSLRQTIAMKQRVDRERVALVVAEGRCGDEAVGRADKAHRKAIEEHRRRVSALYRQTRWDEFELADNDDGELDEDEIHQLLQQAFIGTLWKLSERDEFLDTPVETLVDEIARDLGRTRMDDEPSSAPPEPEPQDEPAAAEAGPPPRPPDLPPHPEPYVPPWEKLRPGQVFPGGSGW